MKYNLDRLKQRQFEIGGNVILENQIPSPIQTVGGADISFTRASKVGYAAIVVFSYPDLNVLESVEVEKELSFPYIPGYLGFREWPLIEEGLNRLKKTPGLLICDGQGLAHPRHAGLACHVGVESGLVTIGCAKSRLVGEYEEPGPLRGDRGNLVWQGNKVGEVVRTRDHVKPLFISPGHRIDFETSTAMVLSMCLKYRQPIPIRAAHRTVNAFRKKKIHAETG